MTEKPHLPQRCSSVEPTAILVGRGATHWRARLGLAMGLGVPLALLVVGDPATAEPLDTYGGTGGIGFDVGVNLPSSFGATFDDVSPRVFDSGSPEGSWLGGPFGDGSLATSDDNVNGHFSLPVASLDSGNQQLVGNGFRVGPAQTNIDGKDFDRDDGDFVPFTGPVSMTLGSGVLDSGEESPDSSDGDGLVNGGMDGLANDGAIGESEGEYNRANNWGDVDTRDDGRAINLGRLDLPDSLNASDPPEGGLIESDLQHSSVDDVDLAEASSLEMGGLDSVEETAQVAGYDEYGINQVLPMPSQNRGEAEQLLSESTDLPVAQVESLDKPDTPLALNPFVVGENGSYDWEPLEPRARYEAPLDATQLASKVGSFLISNAAADADVLPRRTIDPLLFSRGRPADTSVLNADSTATEAVGGVAPLFVDVVADLGVATVAHPSSRTKHGPIQYELDPDQPHGGAPPPLDADVEKFESSTLGLGLTELRVPPQPSTRQSNIPGTDRVRLDKVPVYRDKFTDKGANYQYISGLVWEGGVGGQVNSTLPGGVGASFRAIPHGWGREVIEFTPIFDTSPDNIKVKKVRFGDFRIFTGRLKKGVTGVTGQLSVTSDERNDGRGGKIFYENANVDDEGLPSVNVYGDLSSNYRVTTILAQGDIPAGRGWRILIPNRFIGTGTRTIEPSQTGLVYFDYLQNPVDPHDDFQRTVRFDNGFRQRDTYNLTLGYGGNNLPGAKNDPLPDSSVAGGETMFGVRYSRTTESHEAKILHSDRPGVVTSLSAWQQVESIGPRFGWEVMGSATGRLGTGKSDSALSLPGSGGRLLAENPLAFSGGLPHGLGPTAYGRFRGEQAVIYNAARSGRYLSTTTVMDDPSDLDGTGEVRAKSSGSSGFFNGVEQSEDVTAFYQEGQITDIDRVASQSVNSREVETSDDLMIGMDRTVVRTYTKEIEDPHSVFDGDKKVTVVETLNPVDGSAEVVETSKKRSIYEDVDKTRTTKLDKHGNGTIKEVVTTDRLGYRRTQTKNITVDNGTRRVSEDVKVSGELAPDVHRISTQVIRPGGRLASTETVFKDGFFWDTTLYSFNTATPDEVTSNEEELVVNWFGTQNRTLEERIANADGIATRSIVEDGSAGTKTTTDRVFNGSTVVTTTDGVTSGTQSVDGSLTVEDITYESGLNGMSIVAHGGRGLSRSVRSSMVVAEDGSLSVQDADDSNDLESIVSFNAATGTANISEAVDLPLMASKENTLSSSPDSNSIEIEIESADGRSNDSTRIETAENSTKIIERDTSTKEQRENVVTVENETVVVSRSTETERTRDDTGRIADITEISTSAIGADGAISLGNVKDVDAYRNQEDIHLVSLTNVNPQGQTMNIDIRTTSTPGTEPSRPVVTERRPLEADEFELQSNPVPVDADELAVLESPPAEESAAEETAVVEELVVDEFVVDELVVETPLSEVPLTASLDTFFEPPNMSDDAMEAIIDDHNTGLHCPHLPLGSWDPNAPQCPVPVCVEAPADGSIATRPDGVDADAVYVRLEFNGVLFDCWVPPVTSAIVV